MEVAIVIVGTSKGHNRDFKNGKISEKGGETAGASLYSRVEYFLGSLQYISGL